MPFHRLVSQGRRPECSSTGASRRARRRTRVLVGALAIPLGSVLTPKSLHAQTLFWDTNGSAPGSSNNPDHTAPGTWGVDPFWSQDPTGNSPTTTWSRGADAIFSAGATQPYTITVAGNQTANSITFGETVPLTLAGGTMTLTGAATINSNAEGVTVTSILNGTAGLNVGGNLILSAPNTYINPTNIFGTLQANNSSALGTSTVNIANGGSLVLLDGAPTLGNTIASINGGTLSAQGNISHTYSGPISLDTGGGTIDTQTALTIGAALTGSGGLTKTGAATLHVTNFNVPALTITAGNVHVLPSNRSTGSTSVLASVPIIAAGSQLDIEDNALIITYSASDTTHSTRDAIRNLLVNGRNAPGGQPGAWNGLGGITSTFAHTNGNGFNLAIGYGDNEDIALVRGSGSYTAFGGQTVASNTVLIQMTRGADATLDGVVDAQDVTILGSHFNKPNSGQWVFGDFDYSGTCDATDVTTLGSTFGKTTPTLSPAQMTAEFGAAFTQAFEGGLAGAVPEPASLTLLGLGGLAMMGKRPLRRRLGKGQSS